jgi:uncharacterized DUF497 family protein
MEFEWDEKKRLSNIKKHGLDFINAKYVFEDAMTIKFPALGDFGEHRFKIIGYYKDKTCVAVVIFTQREEKTRIISFRVASKKEGRLYYGNSIVHH